MSSYEKNTELVQNIEEKYSVLMQMAKNKKHKKTVVDAGLLKAGKSSLCNALVGKSVFGTDVVRATIENAQIEMDDYILLDTPGLDARDEDTNAALAGYEMADVILFVHNLQEGELSQTEVDSIKQIADIFDNWDMFFKNVILVLTHKDQVEDHYEAICKQIDEQCKKVFNNQFAKTFCIDSIGYMKGLQEKKTRLMQDSGILELQKAVTHCINDEYDLQYFRLEKLKKECIKEIVQTIATIRTKMPTKGAGQIEKLKQAKVEMQKLVEDSISGVSAMEVQIWENRSFKYLGKAKDYHDYSSESSAHSAGISAIESMIIKAKKSLKEYGFGIVDDAEKYISVSGKQAEIKTIFSDTYEKLRELAKSADFSLNTNFDISIKNFSTTQTDQALADARQEAKYDPFSSASYYASAYSSNLYIDYDYKTTWVRGMFGRETQKEVKIYQYDADGAMDDVSSDMASHLMEVRDKAMKAVKPVFQEAKKNLCDQFKDLTNTILEEIDDAIKQEEEKQKTNNNALNQAKKLIAELEGYKKDIETL